MRRQITFSVPEDVHRYVQMRVEATGYGSASEYFRELIREDRQKQMLIARQMHQAKPPEPEPPQVSSRQRSRSTETTQCDHSLNGRSYDSLASASRRYR